MPPKELPRTDVARILTDILKRIERLERKIEKPSRDPADSVFLPFGSGE